MVKNRNILTSKEAAEFLKVSQRTLEGYRLYGRGPTWHRFGEGPRSPTYYRLEDLRAWQREQKARAA